MNKQEAFQALNEGARITHVYFSSDEWMKSSQIGYEFEDGGQCTEIEFWNYRVEDYWDDGWSLY